MWLPCLPAFTQAGTERHLITTESLLSGSALLTWGQGILWAGEQPPWSPGAGSQPAAPLRGQMCPRRAWGGRNSGAGQEEVRGAGGRCNKAAPPSCHLGQAAALWSLYSCCPGRRDESYDPEASPSKTPAGDPETQQNIRPSRSQGTSKGSFTGVECKVN